MTNGETSIITQLVEQVSALVATDRERENTRVLLRAQDNHWRDRMEKKTDELVNGLTDLGRRLEDLPSTMDQRVRDKLTAHEDAEKMAARTARSWIIMLVVAVVLAVASTMEFVNSEDAAGVVFAMLAVCSPFVLWILNRK